MKDPLLLRPVYHQVERRTDMRICLALLACHLLVGVEETLLDHGARTAWQTLRDLLKTLQTCTVVLATETAAPYCAFR